MTADVEIHPDQLEVLNISNANGDGDIVLNDEKLLDLVQLYPFLYNPRVKGFNDPDYEEWAWKKITTAFNETYGSVIPEIPFTVAKLRHRWMMLQPVILSLSKSYDMNAMPGSLRQHVVKLSMQMTTQPTIEPSAKGLTAAQTIILQNIPMVERLPLELRKSLEREIMEVILNAEISFKSTIKANMVDNKKVEEDYTNFLKEIGMGNTILPEDAIVSSNDIHTAAEQTAMSKTDDVPLQNYIKPLIVSTEVAHVPFFANPKTHVNSEDQIISNNIEEKPLIIPVEHRQWIPLSEASSYIRNCKVRLKRTRVNPDDIPLARVKKEKLW